LGTKNRRLLHNTIQAANDFFNKKGSKHAAEVSSVAEEGAWSGHRRAGGVCVYVWGCDAYFFFTAFPALCQCFLISLLGTQMPFTLVPHLN